VPDHVVLRLVRPYQSVEEYLEAEACWIEPKRMLLIDARPLPNDTVVRFAVSIRVGEPLIRAEARVIGYQRPSASFPGGVLVRFRRFGESTKAFIDRAQQVRAQQKSSADAPGEPESSTPEPSVVAPSMPVPAADAVDRPSASAPGHGQPRRAVRPVDAPANRDELLERLRQRAKTLSTTKAAS
jgi:hypothetical protein